MLAKMGLTVGITDVLDVLAVRDLGIGRGGAGVDFASTTGTSFTTTFALGGDVERPVILRINAENPPDLGTSCLEFRVDNVGAIWVGFAL